MVNIINFSQRLQSALCLTDRNAALANRPPGHTFFRLFDRSTPPSKFGNCRLATAVSLLVLLVVAWIIDLVDVFQGDYKVFYLDSHYGSAKPVIMIMSYCHTQLALFMAIYTVVFLLRKQPELRRCSERLQVLFKKYSTEQSVLPSVYCLLRWCFWGGLVAALAAVLTTLADPRFWATSGEPRRYGCFAMPTGPLNLYFHW